MGLYLSPVCERVRGQISLDLDGELSQLEQAMVARHLERCAECGAFRDELTAFTAALREAPLETPERPILLPPLRRARFEAVRDAALRVGAAAAGVALIVGLGLGERNIAGSGSRASARPAYLDSPSYESRLVKQASDFRLTELHSLVRPL
jgi:predicted anti-sigma-YlaC factor YlaD